MQEKSRVGENKKIFNRKRNEKNTKKGKKGEKKKLF
jgi:hypothetical protein